MTQRTFKDHNELAAALAFDLIEALKASGVAATFSASNISCSSYVEVEGRKVRFSDHADHYGSDITLRIDRVARPMFWRSIVEEREDEFVTVGHEFVGEDERTEEDEYDHIVIGEDDYRALINEAITVTTR